MYIHTAERTRAKLLFYAHFHRFWQNIYHTLFRNFLLWSILEKKTVHALCSLQWSDRSIFTLFSLQFNYLFRVHPRLNPLLMEAVKHKTKQNLVFTKYLCTRVGFKSLHACRVRMYVRMYVLASSYARFPLVWKDELNSQVYY